jgi:hypothetical protein
MTKTAFKINKIISHYDQQILPKIDISGNTYTTMIRNMHQYIGYIIMLAMGKKVANKNMQYHRVTV